jgi:hypothetical protein
MDSRLESALGDEPADTHEELTPQGQGKTGATTSAENSAAAANCVSPRGPGAGAGAARAPGTPGRPSATQQTTKSVRSSLVGGPGSPASRSLTRQRLV